MSIIIWIIMLTTACMALLLSQISPIQLRQAHLQTNTPIHQEFINIQFYNVAQTIGIIVIIAAVGYGCWKLRGFFSSSQRESQTTVLVVSDRRAANASPTRKVAEPRQKQARIAPKVDYEQYKMKGQPKSSLKRQAPSSSNPYITEKQYNSQYKKWDSGDSFNSKAKQTQLCGLCNELSQQGERPRIVVSCSQDHCFHLNCLNEHRSRILTFMGGNGLYKCPKCKDPYSANVTLYCNVCRKNKINFNLSKMSDQTGHIQKDQLRDIYGDCCQNCRVI